MEGRGSHGGGGRSLPCPLQSRPGVTTPGEGEGGALGLEVALCTQRLRVAKLTCRGTRCSC